MSNQPRRTTVHLQLAPSLPAEFHHPYGISTCPDCGATVIIDLLTDAEVVHTYTDSFRIQGDPRTMLWDLHGSYSCSVCLSDD